MSQEDWPPARLNTLEWQCVYRAVRELERARAIWVRACELLPQRFAYRLPINDAAADMREYLAAVRSLAEAEAER